jgi:tryptophan-rich sensory protein
MTTAGAALTALAACATAAALEGVCAGPGVRQRLGELRLPRFAPPFGVWMVIGGLYYVICFAVLYRLLRAGTDSGAERAALGLALLLLVGNAGWNYFFFRRRDLRASLVFNGLYAAVAVALAVALFRVDPASGWIFLPYLVYLVYGTWWGYSLWRLNR